MTLPKKSTSEFVQNVLLLFSGTALSQLIPFLILPVLQKYFFTPADFGLLAAFVAFSEIFINTGSLKLDYAIVMKQKTQDALETASAAFTVLTGIAFLSLLVSVIFILFPVAGELHDIGLWLLLVPVCVLAAGANSIAAYWFNRKNRYGAIASNKIWQSITGEGCKLLLGYAKTASGLVIGRVAGLVAAGGIMLVKLKNDLVKDKLQLGNHKPIRHILSENRQFVLFATPSVFISALINLLFIHLFILEFNESVAGMISVSVIYVSAALGILSGSFSQVFYGKIAAIANRHELLSVYLKFAGVLALFSALVISVVWVIPGNWVTFVLGEKWTGLLEYCRILSLWLGVWFVSSSLAFVYIRLGKQGTMLLFDLLHLLMVPAGFYTGLRISEDVYGALWGFTLAQVAYYILAVILAVVFIKTSDKLE